MDLTILRYIVFIVAVIILIWAAFELRSRQVRRKKLKDKTPGAWVKLDFTKAHLEEEGPLSLPKPHRKEYTGCASVQSVGSHADLCMVCIVQAYRNETVSLHKGRVPLQLVAYCL